MSRRTIEQLAKVAKRKQKQPARTRFKTSIYVEKKLFEQFRAALGRDTSRTLEDFMRAYLES